VDHFSLVTRLVTGPPSCPRLTPGGALNVPRKPTVLCAACGKLMWSGKGCLPSGRSTCQPCRRIERVPSVIRPPAGRVHPCPVCLMDFQPKRNCRSATGWTRVCNRVCVNPIPRSEGDHRSTRWRRELAVPGLGRVERTRLLRMWISRGVPCAYCSATPTSVDHVVPLSRGGTHWEGNLVPACKRCNSSKGTRLLTEWKSLREVA